MFRYAINLSKDLTICDCESKWNIEYGWTEQMYTGDIYKCKLVNCPYDDACINHFKEVNGEIIFDEQLYLQDKKAKEEEVKLNTQDQLFNQFKNDFILKNIPDTQAKQIPLLYESWNDFIGKPLPKGSRIEYENKLWRTLQDIEVVKPNEPPTGGELRLAPLYELV